MATKVEFAVQISCDSCVTKIEDSLKNIEGVKQVKVSKDNGGTVLVESELPSSVIKEKIESTGRKAVLKGCGGEQGEEEKLEVIPVDSSGVCEICMSDRSDQAEEAKVVDKIVEGDKKDETVNLKKKRSRKDSKSDDEEELELKYSSDSEDGDLSTRINAFNNSKDEDIWKIDEDLDAEFDVIDADEDKSDGEGKGADDQDNDGSPDSKKRKITGADNEEGNDKTDDGKSSWKKNKLNVSGNKFLSALKASKVRKGEFNTSSFNIALHVLILPVAEDQNLTEEEAQEIKDHILHELFRKTQQVLAKDPDAFLLRFTDCKLVNPGWLLVNCDNKQTFDWLLNWSIPKISEKDLKTIPALDKAPLQKIKFFIKSKWASDEDMMLKLIHLQNRDIDTKRWVLEEKKASPGGSDQFKFKIDCASVRALEKLNWSFFYELFAVKVTEYNGKLTSTLPKTKQIRAN